MAGEGFSRSLARLFGLVRTVYQVRIEELVRWRLNDILPGAFWETVIFMPSQRALPIPCDVPGP
jgi:hypothetical protein